MEGFAPALLAVMLLEMVGRMPMLAAILADRSGAILSVLVGMVAANALVQMVAAVAGAAISPIMGPEARMMLLAIAFGLAALSLIRRPRIRDRLERWRIGALPTSFIALTSLSLGGTASFVTFAIAAYHGQLAAGMGGAIGAIVPGFIAMAVGEAMWSRWPLGWIRLIVALSSLAIAAWAALNAFRMI